MLDPSLTLSECGLGRDATVQLVHRGRGGGCHQSKVADSGSEAAGSMPPQPREQAKVAAEAKAEPAKGPERPISGSEGSSDSAPPASVEPPGEDVEGPIQFV